ALPEQGRRELAAERRDARHGEQRRVREGSGRDDGRQLLRGVLFVAGFTERGRLELAQVRTLERVVFAVCESLQRIHRVPRSLCGEGGQSELVPSRRLEPRVLLERVEVGAIGGRRLIPVAEEETQSCGLVQRFLRERSPGVLLRQRL